LTLLVWQPKDLRKGMWSKNSGPNNPEESDLGDFWETRTDME